MFGHQRTFINCLPSNDLEMWFQGTIFCEIEDLDQVPPKQTLLQSIVLVKRAVQGYFYLSKTVKIVKIAQFNLVFLNLFFCI